MKNKIFFLLIMIVVVSCVNPTPRKPISYSSGSYIQESVKLNKQINALQEKAIKYYLAQDSLSEYISSSNGFWYAYKKQINVKARNPKIGDEVFFEYQISDLANNILYSQDELGENRLLIDKEDVESGLQNGLKLMKVGEEIQFIFPSYKAFGFAGDRERIGINQPLIYNVKLNKIKTNNEND